MPSAQTLTGNFPIGYRFGNSPWQKDLDAAFTWTADHSFAALDLASHQIGEIKKLTKLGLQIGSVDLTDWHGFHDLISPDKSKRAQAVETARTNIEKGTEAGARLFFTVMLPEKSELPRAENYQYLVESYAALVPTLEKTGAKIVVEGWPGPGALCCTPETYRALFRDIPSSAIGVNYDPSHLLRMGVDPIRFLGEFLSRVYHVHGKDTELNAEHLYEFGHEQPATFAAAPAYGAWSWRYTLPGHGVTRWSTVLEILAKAGYRGLISIELEDARFNGTEAGEKLGLIKSREFLEGC